MNILDSYIWQNWLDMRKNYPSRFINFSSYLDFILCYSNSGYCWYKGYLVEQTQELAETQQKDVPFKKEFKVQFNPEILSHPFLCHVPTIRREHFLINLDIKNMVNLTKNPRKTSIISSSCPLLNMPNIVDYTTLAFSLLFAKTALVNEDYLMDDKNQQAFLLISSVCDMIGIIENIPTGENIIMKFIKEIISNSGYIHQINEFFVKSNLIKQ